MKVVIFSNIPSPYFVEYLNELGKKVEITAYFERAMASDRDLSWKSINAKTFEYHFFKGILIGTETALSFEVIPTILTNRKALFIFANPTTPTGIIGIMVCKLLKIPYVLQSEGGLAKSGVGLKEKFKKFVLSGAALYLSGMKPENDYFISYGASPEKVKRYCFASFYDSDIPMDKISLQTKNIIKENLKVPYKKIVLYVGRMLHVKGIDVLLHATGDLSNDVGVYLVGGDITEDYKKIIEHNSFKNYHFIPHLKLDELKQYYQIADIFVLPTRSDTWGLVINEAMTYSLPIITTKSCVAGLELIKDEKNGFLVDSEDYKKMNNRIKFLLDHPSIAVEMGNINHDIIKCYTYENMANQIWKYIEHYWEVEN